MVSQVLGWIPTLLAVMVIVAVGATILRVFTLKCPRCGSRKSYGYTDKDGVLTWECACGFVSVGEIQPKAPTPKDPVPWYLDWASTWLPIAIAILLLGIIVLAVVVPTLEGLNESGFNVSSMVT